MSLKPPLKIDIEKPSGLIDEFKGVYFYNDLIITNAYTYFRMSSLIEREEDYDYVCL